jgi:hypothetical protein
MHDLNYEEIGSSAENHLIGMAAIAMANGVGMVLAGFILASIVGFSPQQLIMPDYDPPLKIMPLSSLK